MVHEDPYFVVVDKPSGLLSVPAKDPSITDHVRARVQSMYPEATGPMSVHRLDMETSGLLIVAKTPQAHRGLSIQFQNREVVKRYIAKLEGPPDQQEGVITLPIRLDVERRPYQIVDFEHGKEAITHYRVLAHLSEQTVELTPKTGRSHQLRVHCAQGLRQPIMGDRLYGRAHSASRLLLHAAFLRFSHPITREVLEVQSPSPFSLTANTL